MLIAIANATAAAPLTAEHFEVPPPVVMVRASGMPDLPPLPPSSEPAKAKRKSSRIAAPALPLAEKGLELEFSVRIPDPAPTVVSTEETPLESNPRTKPAATSGRRIVSVPPVMVAAPATPLAGSTTQTTEVLHGLVADQLANKARRLLSTSVVAPGQLAQLLALARQVSQSGLSADAPAKTEAIESLAYDLAQQKFTQQLQPTLEQPVLDTRVLTALFSAAAPWKGTQRAHIDKSAALLEDLYQSRWESSLNPALSAPLVARDLLFAMMADYQRDAGAKALAAMNSTPEPPSAVERTADIYLPMDCAAYEPSPETVEVEYQIRRGGAIERKVTERPARIVTDFEIKPGDSLRKTLSAWAPPGHLVFWEATPKGADLVFNAPAHFGKDRQAAIQRLMATVTQVTGLTLTVFENNVSAVRGSIPSTVCRSAYK